MKRIYRLSFLIVLILSFGVGVQAQPDYQAVQENIADRLSNGDILGTAIVYIYPDGRMQFVNRGSLSSDRKQTVDKNTIFEIGSVSKTFTALMMIRMAEEGLFSLDTPIENILPGSVSVPSYEGHKITLKHLATHTSGLPRMPNNFHPADPLNPYADYSKTDMYVYLENYSLTEAPGTSFQYSNLGMGLLGHILELKSKKTYAELLEQYIAGPLGMNDTYVTIPKSKEQRFAAPYNYGDAVKHWEFPTMTGAGGIRSTAGDMAIYMKAQMGLQLSNLESAIKKTHQLRFDSGDGLVDGVGLGWLQSTVNDTILWHDGGTGGFQSFVGLNTQGNTAVVVLSNGKDGVNDIGLHLLDERHKLKEIVSVDSETLDSYTGTYAHSSGIKYYVSRDGNKLQVKISGQPQYRVFPKSDHRFYYKVVPAEIEFSTDSTDAVKGLTLFQNGQTIKATRISNETTENNK